MYQQEQPHKISKSSKSVVQFQLRISDQLRHFYNQKTKTLNQQLRAQFIKSATVYQKQLDNPLAWYKKTLAWMLAIKTKHQFIIFQLQSGIYGSVDFYMQNRVLLRLGTMDTIMEKNAEGKRKDSAVVSKHQKPFMIKLSQMNQQKLVTFDEFIRMIYQITPASGFSQVKFNGVHFTRALMKELKKQKKGKGSIIHEKLINQSVGFVVI